MIGDILTVLWKEGIELLHLRGSVRSTLAINVFPVLILGVFLPLQSGRHWAESPINLIVWAWMPLLFTITVIGDAIAGEKERHTLETLLASRLSDLAILFGKLLASMLYAFGLTGLIVLIGLVTVNLAYYSEGPILINPLYLILGGLFVFLTTMFVATAGILVSLKAKTVRQALQTLSFGIMIVSVLPILVFGFLPSGIRKQVFSILSSMDGRVAFAAVLGGFILIDALLLTAAIHRFKRNKLMTY
jgi:ABC-2 type transport system permease protein